MFSIYTTLYNLKNGFIDWKSALDNFTSFADEVVVGIFSSDIRTSNLINCYVRSNERIKSGECKIKLVNSESTLEDLDFDGKLKNAALKRCTQPYCILLDADERIDVKDKFNWQIWADYLFRSPSVDALLIPVFDLYNSDKEYKSVGTKWYLHKNLPYLHRGIVNFAKKENGKVDTNKSDTCELLSFDDKLCGASLITGNLTPSYIQANNIPKVWHLGWLDKEKRLKSNAFWQPIWNNRAGEEVKNIIHSKERLDRIEYWPHKLKLWYE